MKCAYANCGVALDSSYVRSGRRVYCSERCCSIDQARRGYSIVQSGEGAPTAKAPVEPARPAKRVLPETPIDRWARGFERRIEEQRAAEKELATRSTEERTQVEANKAERAELDRLMKKYVAQTYTDAEIARLRVLRAKHIF